MPQHDQPTWKFHNRHTWLSLCLGTLLCLSGCTPSTSVEEHSQAQEITNTVTISPEAMKRLQIQTAPVALDQSGQSITTTGEIRANETQVFHISPFVEGRVTQDKVLLGDTVHQGQMLAMVQNQQIAQIQANYIHELHQNEIDVSQAQSRFNLAKKVLDREQSLFEEGVSPRRDLDAAESEYEQAKAALEGLQEHHVHIQSEGKALMGAYGLSPSTIHNETLQTNSPVTAPKGGVIIDKQVAAGDMVTPQTSMYTVADLSQVWLDIAIYPQDFHTVAVGLPITFTTDSLPKELFQGEVNYIPPKTNPQSKTFVARAFLKNPGTRLKPGMFGTVTISLPENQPRLLVPELAVQRHGAEVFVFIPIDTAVFQKRSITLGKKTNAGYVVIQGLDEGETVVTQGAFTLKAELLKNTFEGEGH